MTDAQTLNMLLSGGRKVAKAPRKPAARAPFRTGQMVVDARGGEHVVERCTSKIVSFVSRPGYTFPVWYFKAAEG